MASRVRIACALSAAALAVTGCVSMPSSGPPSSLRVNQADVGQSQNYVGLYPQPPQPRWDPETVVQGFLIANASYYTATDIVKQYLTPSTQQKWKPGSSVTVFAGFNVTPPALSGPASKSQQATVSVSGQVRAALNGSGQQLYASPQGNGAGTSQSPSSPSTSSASCPVTTGKQCSYAFKLDKVDGQWRIANAPNYLLLNEDSFDHAWKPQDLYFYDTVRRVLVPDSVFVPIGTGETDLLNKLAHALKNGPGDANWLSDAISNVFPEHITSVNVSVVANNVAEVNLKGTLTAADEQSLQYVAAELVWTLTVASPNGPPITGVQLEINGITQAPVIRSSTYDPYPSGAASFTFVDKNGVPQSLCGSTKTGAPVPIFGHSAGGEVATCGESAASSPPSSVPSPTASASTTATQRANSHKPGQATKPPGKTPASKAPANTVSMVAVSPDGKYIAEVSNGNQLSMGPLGGHAALKPVISPSSEITSISWDRQDDLWLAQDGSVLMVPQPQAGQFGRPSQVSFPGGSVDALSVAPDGVRIAMIVQGQSGNQSSQLLLASINPTGSQNSERTLHGNEPAAPVINSPQVPLGPGIVNATALTWYDADDLIVLTPSAAGSELVEVPVDGRASTGSLAPPGGTVDSIAAGNSQNVVVAGLSNGQLEVSAGLEGPWESVRSGGSAPAYLIPPAPTAPPYLVPTPPAK